jgi:hypothetical protein
MRKATILMLFVLIGCDDEPVIATQTQPPTEPEPEIVVDAEGWETTKGTEPEPEPEPLPAFRPQPPGFPDKDEYTSHSEACLAIITKEVPEDKPGWRRAILGWCEHRSYHASRNTIIKSRVDGSQIHDRDRPTAWIFYEQAVVDGRLDPDNCPFHGVNRKIRHPRKCQYLRVHWPFKDVPLSDKRKWEWATHPHDMERFGARGPHDWNANAYKIIPGCWDPAQLERFDVGITMTVRASLNICEKYGCVTKGDIRAHWGRRG